MITQTGVSGQGKSCYVQMWNLGFGKKPEAELNFSKNNFY